MPIDFHAEQNRSSYATRQADPSWIATIQSMVNVRGKQILDIGCGGGIYSKALAYVGAAHVTGIDFSEEMLKGARENCQGYAQIDFVAGNALHTGLADGQYDLILERALIHHLAHDDLKACFVEALRLLKPGGLLLVQDRTQEDCLLPGSETNIRGYFFACYPTLVEKETARRYESPTVIEALQEVGFAQIEARTLWETRAVYPNIDRLSEDLLARTGRSILHELTDEELQKLVEYIRKELQAKQDERLVEQDRWTIWQASKKRI